MLYLRGQDIRKLSIGLLENNKFVRLEEFRVSPELFLSQLKKTFDNWDVDLDSFNGIVLVNGPGSFTATRVSIAIANTLAFSHELPVFSIENPKYLDDKTLIDSVDLSGVLSKSYATVVYDRPAGITKQK